MVYKLGRQTSSTSIGQSTFRHSQPSSTFTRSSFTSRHIVLYASQPCASFSIVAARLLSRMRAS
jgi:hypothetical protein